LFDVHCRRFSQVVLIIWGERILFAAIGSRCWHRAKPWHWGSNKHEDCRADLHICNCRLSCAGEAHSHHHRDRATASHSRVSCETVRAYVAQVGLAQAKAMAQAAGMTQSEEREAAQCLQKKI